MVIAMISNLAGGNSSIDLTNKYERKNIKHSSAQYYHYDSYYQNKKLAMVCVTYNNNRMGTALASYDGSTWTNANLIIQNLTENSYEVSVGSYATAIDITEFYQ